LVEFVAITLKLESVRLKLFRCFRAIKISTTHKFTGKLNESA